MTDTIWVAFCKECGELDKAPNGGLIEAAAKRHKRDNLGHTIILGVYIEAVDAVFTKV